MSTTEELLALELEAWQALSSDGDTAERFFEGTLAGKVLMLLPSGMVIDDRAQAIASMRGAPWSSFDLSDTRVHQLTDASAVVAYRAVAHRGSDTYRALCTSTYVREGGRWRLALHQQTPV